MTWSGRNVFITGANGFVGSWLARELVEQGANVVVLVRDLTPKAGLALHPGLTDRVTQVRGDLLDYALLQRILTEFDIDSVFHLAAQAIVAVANRSPLSTFEANIRGTWQLLEACRLSPLIKRVVVASSDKAYGDQPVLPYTEDQPLNGIHPYDASKVCTDIIARSYGRSYGLPVAITRCGNIYGGGDLNWSRIIPETMKAVIEDRSPVLRSDGTLVRDYFYVRDCVDSYLTLGEQIAGRSELYGEAFNFGTGRPISVLELVTTIVALSGKRHITPDIQGKGKPSQEIKAQFLDSRRAERDLGWRSGYTLEEGLGETLAWYTAYLAGAPLPALALVR
ncbi:MAG: GDP-mannose 4,6-dehydratase [Chloroflexi bacterium]|nr:GDP-mannose 4,6-dehydratase [Chloroflexota bacterium]